MSTLSEIEIRRIRDETLRDFIKRVTKNAQNPATIGKRVLAVKFTLQPDETLSKFASRLRISVPSACVAVQKAQSSVFDVRMSKSNSVQ